jgi:hypothetical protein
MQLPDGSLLKIAPLIEAEMKERLSIPGYLVFTLVSASLEGLGHTGRSNTRNKIFFSSRFAFGSRQLCSYGSISGAGPPRGGDEAVK